MRNNVCPNPYPEAITVTIPEGFTYKQLQERLRIGS